MCLGIRNVHALFERGEIEMKTPIKPGEIARKRIQPVLFLTATDNLELCLSDLQICIRAFFGVIFNHVSGIKKIKKSR